MPAPDDADEWITIAEAARRLGVDERQARRVASRLSTWDRTLPGERPAKVRWGALNVRTLSGQESEPTAEVGEIAPDQAPDGAVLVSEVSGNGPAELSEVSDLSETSDRSDREALLDQLRSENAYLRARLEATEVAAGEYRRLLLVAIPQQDAAAELPPAPPDPPRGWLANIWAALRSGKGGG